MAHVGYIRVSSHAQNSARQLENVALDKVFEEKVSASSDKRVALGECMNYLRECDTLHVHSIDRLARNLVELQNLVQELTAKNVIVHFHTENMIFGASNKDTGKSSPMQELLFQMLGAFAQFERSLIRERQQEGIEKAKKEGRHLGRPRKISLEDKTTIQTQLQTGVPPRQIAQTYNVDVSSIYKLQK